MEWIDAKEQLPNKGEYFLIETPYCKYPCCVGFFNGVNWRNADDKDKVMNVNYWKYIKLRK